MNNIKPKGQLIAELALFRSLYKNSALGCCRDIEAGQYTIKCKVYTTRLSFKKGAVYVPFYWKGYIVNINNFG